MIAYMSEHLYRQGRTLRVLDSKFAPLRGYFPDSMTVVDLQNFLKATDFIAASNSGNSWDILIESSVGDAVEYRDVKFSKVLELRTDAETLRIELLKIPKFKKK